jgi:cyclopropane fatty-acyl-phospholipid synthase-like methyltransferase
MTEQRRPLAAAPAPVSTDPFEEVRALFRARDRALGKVLFAEADWARTRLACDILDGVADVADIGIGQGQLVNALARQPGIRAVHAYDFRKHSKLIEPETGSYVFRAWDITEPPTFEPPAVDVVVAMEVLEHIAVDALPAALARLRGLARHGALLITVPYRETPPLFHHDKPSGHKQSFDDAKIERLFGPNCRYANFRDKWYVVFCHDRLDGAAPCAVDEIAGIARDAMGLP